MSLAAHPGLPCTGSHLGEGPTNALCQSRVPAPFCSSLQLEDDIVAKPNYLSTMKNFALQQPSEDWMILEFSQLGFIGRLLQCRPHLCPLSTVSQYLTSEPCWKCPLYEDVPESPVLPCLLGSHMPKGLL